MTWRPIIGKSFKTPDDFSRYVDSVVFGLWRPRFVVVHNSSTPNLALFGKWMQRGTPSDEQWMQNLVGFYRDTNHWNAGPHLFVTPRSICVFSPLNQQGTHSPSWNSISWGVETVGDFETEKFEGPVKDNLLAALGILHIKAGLSPLPYVKGQRGIHFHKEDTATTHKDCPGRYMDKGELVAGVQSWIAAHDAGDHAPATV